MLFSTTRFALAFLKLALGASAIDEIFNVTFANELADGTIGGMKLG